MGGGEALETKESQQHQKQAEPHHSPTTTGGGDHDPSTGGGGVGDAAPYILYNIISWGGVAWIPMRVGGESGAKDFLSDAGKNQVHPASF